MKTGAALKKLLASGLLALAWLTLSPDAMANGYSWVKVTGGSWTDPMAWSPPGVPAAGDTVTIQGAMAPLSTPISGVAGTDLAGLTISGNAILTDGSLSVSTGTFHWSGGTIGSLGNSMGVTLSSSTATLIDGTVQLSSGEIDNAGPIAWVAGALQGGGGAILRNSGTFTITTGMTSFGYSGGNNSCQLFNTGTIVVVGSGVTTNVGVWGFHNAGTINFTGTGTLEWQHTSNTQHTLDDTGKITGTGTLLFDDQSASTSLVTVTGTTTVGAGATLQVGVGGKVSVGATGGTLAGPGTLLWTGGNISGNGNGNTLPAMTWAPNLAVHLTGAAQKDMSYGYIVSQGSVLWDQGDLGIGDGAYLTNVGTLTASGALSITFGQAATNYVFQLENRGTISKIGTGQLTAEHLTLLNYGTVNASGGSLFIVQASPAGPNVLESGSTLAGSVISTGEISLSGTSSIAAGGTLEITATATPTWRGLLDGTGTLQGPGTFKVDGGQISSTVGPITFDATSNVLIAANAVNTELDVGVASGGALTFAGTTTWASGVMQIDNGFITNSGSWTMQNAGPITPNSTYVVNTGTFTADPGATGTAELTVALNNAGTVIAKSGTFLLDYDNAGYVQTAGETRLAGGSIVSHDANTPPRYFILDIQGGSLTGSGTVDANLTSEATVAPGTASAAGTLTITQTYVQSAAGTLYVGLGGTQAGQFDVLAVGGDVTLAGALGVSRIGSYVPSVADTYKVLTSGGAQADNGTFATVTQPTGVTLTTTYDANDVVLGVTQVSIPEAGAPEAGVAEAGAPDGGGVADGGAPDSGTATDASVDSGMADGATTGGDASLEGGEGDGGASSGGGGSTSSCSCLVAGGGTLPNGAGLGLLGLAITVTGARRWRRSAPPR